MIRKVLILSLAFIVAHSVLLSTFMQYKDTNSSIEIIEEEKNNAENCLEFEDKIHSYTILQHYNVSLDTDAFYHFYKKLHYYRLHMTDHDEIKLLDNPPEA